jgi:cell wall-associated NlpC family hydrolase
LRKNPASPALIYAGNVEGWEYHVGNLQNKSTLNKLKVGDLLIAGEGVHIGIYIGNGRSISANGEFGARLGTKDISVDYDQGFAFRCTCNM